MTKYVVGVEPNTPPPSWIKGKLIDSAYEYGQLIFIALLTSLLGVVSYYITSGKLAGFLKEDDTKASLDVDKLRVTLSGVRHASKATRAVLLMNHNGAKFVNRMSYVKTTCILEDVEALVRPISPVLKNIPTPLLYTDYQDLRFQQDFQGVNITLDMAMSNRLYAPFSILLQEGDYGYALVALPNVSNNLSSPLGYLLLTFNRDGYDGFQSDFSMEKYDTLLLELINELSKHP